jgi:putative membrane protein
VTGPPVETQPERTGLSWQRTGLGLLAVSGLLAHGAFLGGRTVPLLLGGVVALFGLAVLGVAPLRYRRVRRAVPAGTGVSAPGLAALATGVVALAAVAGGCAVLLYP